MRACVYDHPGVGDGGSGGVVAAQVGGGDGMGTDVCVRACARVSEHVGYSYTRVRGFVRAYTAGSPDAFRPEPGRSAGSEPTIDEPYVDGLSITHGTNQAPACVHLHIYPHIYSHMCRMPSAMSFPHGTGMPRQHLVTYVAGLSYGQRGYSFYINGTLHLESHFAVDSLDGASASPPYHACTYPPVLLCTHTHPPIHPCAHAYMPHARTHPRTPAHAYARMCVHSSQAIANAMLASCDRLSLLAPTTCATRHSTARSRSRLQNGRLINLSSSSGRRTRHASAM